MGKRTRNSILNIIVIIVMQIMALLYSLISKKLFLDSFSISIYGVVDLFNSFFKSLMMLELGFGTVLIFNLYKPIATDNKKEIRKQLSLFKTIYMVISIIILVISLCSLPFLYNIFNIAYDDKIIVYEIYCLNIISLLVKYYFLNKISILNASQTNYVQNISTIIVDLIGFLLKVVSILVFKNPYIFVFSLLLVPSLSYFIQSSWINKHYDVKGIKFASIKDIKDSEILIQIKKYLYATIYNLVFMSMDNMIISAKLSTDAVAYVSNYLIFLDIGGTFIGSISISLRGIMADYKHKENDDIGYFKVFKIVSFLSFFFVSLMIVGFYCMADNFISLWIGSKYLIERKIFIILLLIRLTDSLCEPILSVFSISGYIFKEKIPLIVSALTNLFLTLILIDKIGLFGVYLATLIALAIKWISKFGYVIKGVFARYKSNIIYTYTMYFLIIIFESVFINCLLNVIFHEISSIGMFLLKLIVLIIITCLINASLIFFDNDVKGYLINIKNKWNNERN